MNKADVQVFFDLYFKTSGEVYRGNRYVILKRNGFKPDEEKQRKIVEQRVEGVDSAFHEMNRVMLYKLLKMKDEAK